ncbi:hypothetical protein CesoFtcFv8_011710 [Champsocephalus esox]|uniref:Uncharacterized protein n=1 Tax=Champsocephalus esox TaxID=159716 RepID=A0AAN8GY04_9TELE|nr:hypothetical protein CesoFtcFv8_011710 [Champsocephalus esox]
MQDKQDEQRLQAEEAEADPDPRRVDRTWVVLEADQRRTTGQNSFRISGSTTCLTTASLASAAPLEVAALKAGG